MSARGSLPEISRGGRPTPAVRWWESVRNFWRDGVEFLFPAHCCLCQTELALGQHHSAGGFCETCAVALQESGPGCSTCGGPVGPNLNRGAGCPLCLTEQFRFERVLRLGIYREHLKLACLRAKRGKAGLPLAAALARLTFAVQADLFESQEFAAVIPVPRHWQQEFQQSHNAADTIAAIFSRQLRIPLLTGAVRKLRKTRPQAELSPTERRRNLKHAFAAQLPRRWQGATLLLADDVLTTGSTAQEVSAALLKAGAGRIVVGVVARGIGQRKLLAAPLDLEGAPD